MTTTQPQQRLGRGLDALISSNNPTRSQQARLTVGQIKKNPFQPRKEFDGEELKSLSDSIKTHGVLQPLVVRKVGNDFQLIAGERRLRAAQAAGMPDVPVHIVEFNDQQVFEAALVENIQRSDLNAIEKAQGFKDYLDRFGVNHEQLAQRLGLARSSITNLVNLLEMAPEVQEGIRLNQISEAHAKLLKGIKNKDRQVNLFKQIVAMGLSVKATEGLVRENKDSSTAAAAPKAEANEPSPDERSNHIKSLENDIRQRLATHVEIKIRGKDKGQIVIRFETNDDFMRVMEVLRK